MKVRVPKGDDDDDEEDAELEKYLEGDEDDEEEVEVEYPEAGEDPLPADLAVSPPLLS